MDGKGILFVSHSAAVSGAEVILLELAKHFGNASAFVFQPGPLAERLAATGLSVKISVRAGGVSAVKRGGSIWRVLPLAGRLVAIAREIVRAASGHRVIYANSQKAFVLSAIAAALLRKPLIWHLHDIPDRAHFGWAQLRLQIFLANRCAWRVIVPSAAVARAFVAAGGMERLLRIIPNGVPAPRPDGRTRRELREVLGLPDGPLVGVFSRLAHWKGQHVVLQALADLPDVRCVIAGTALFGEDAYAAELLDLVDRLGLADRVIFLGHRNDIADLMRAVDIVIHPSIAPEPFGLTVVEGMLAGTPVIGTAAGAVPEILDEGRAGWLVAPGDAEGLNGAIGEVFAGAQQEKPRLLPDSDLVEPGATFSPSPHRGEGGPKGRMRGPSAQGYILDVSPCGPLIASHLLGTSPRWGEGGGLSYVFPLPEDVACRVAHARQRAKTLYSAERMVREISAVIDEVLAEATP